jgi:hypothetical protein
MPFTYLGLPLSIYKLGTQSFAPLLQRIESRLFGINKMLSYHGRLLLVNSVFSAMPTYYMCTLLLPPKVIEQIDKYRKHCLWSGGDINKKGKCLAAWEATYRNKKDGGLGIIDINKQNKALLLKFLDKFYNQADTPWVKLTWDKLYQNHNTPPHARHPSGSFWWKDTLKLNSMYRSMNFCHLGNGYSILFWFD